MFHMYEMNDTALRLQQVLRTMRQFSSGFSNCTYQKKCLSCRDDCEAGCLQTKTDDISPIHVGRLHYTRLLGLHSRYSVFRISREQRGYFLFCVQKNILSSFVVNFAIWYLQVNASRRNRHMLAYQRFLQWNSRYISSSMPDSEWLHSVFPNLLMKSDRRENKRRYEPPITITKNLKENIVWSK